MTSNLYLHFEGGWYGCPCCETSMQVCKGACPQEWTNCECTLFPSYSSPEFPSSVVLMLLLAFYLYFMCIQECSFQSFLANKQVMSYVCRIDYRKPKTHCGGIYILLIAWFCFYFIWTSIILGLLARSSCIHYVQCWSLKVGYFLDIKTRTLFQFSTVAMW